MNTLISLLLTGIGHILLFDLFGLKNDAGKLLVSLLWIGSCVFCMTLSYLFTSPAYAVAFLFAAASAYTLIRQNNWVGLLLSACFFALTMGSYQGYIGVTCLITSLSIFFGSLIGFGICLLRRSKSRLANPIFDSYVRIIQGIPTVVLLMILFYVVFGRSNMEAMWVAVIGFTLSFGAESSVIMRGGLDAVDKGQREAALALGFTDLETFFRFLFPQAAVHFLPMYSAGMISLLNETSIVGYIAVQDITKMGDIIRSRTYEAFFPIVVVAVIYFVLAGLVNLLVGRLLRLVNPKRGGRKGLLKGVNMHD
jgi:His/Glu/Gln/Arg/opine family amino acid ABC transporter permease subunit